MVTAAEAPAGFLLCEGFFSATAKSTFAEVTGFGYYKDNSWYLGYIFV